MSWRRVLPRLLVLAIVAAAALWVGLNREYFDAEMLRAGLDALGLWTPVAYLGLYVVGTVAFLPGSLFALLGGALFGPVWGSALNLAGATVGATAAFLVARYLAGDWATQKSAGILKQLLGGVEAEGWRFVAFVRLVPLFPFNLTNYALGLTRIGFLPYALTSLVCMAPGAIAYTWLGYAGREALGGNASAVRYGLLGLGLLAAIAFVPRLVKRIRQRPVGWMDAEELQQQLRSGAVLRVIDVRGADEFSGPLGHILGALNVPLDELEGRTKELRARAAGGIAVVCRTDRRSAVAQRSLHAAGFTNVAVLRGGMERWHALGFETSGGSPWPPAKQEESHA